MNKHIAVLENGGKVLVVGGFNKAWQSFRNNPRVVFWTGDQKEIARTVRSQSIPPNCKAVIVSRFLSHSELGYILQDVRARRLVLFPNKSDGEVTNLLMDMLNEVEEAEGTQPVVEVTKPEPIQEPVQEPVVNKEVEVTTVAKRQMAKKGELNQVLQFVDWNKTNIDNARALMATAIKEMKINTTENSLAQFIRVHRHKLGKANVTPLGTKKTNGSAGKPHIVKHTPKPAKVKEAGLDPILQMFDEAVKNLHDIREFLVATVAENQNVRAELDKIQPLLTAIRSLK